MYIEMHKNVLHVVSLYHDSRPTYDIHEDCNKLDLVQVIVYFAGS